MFRVLGLAATFGMVSSAAAHAAIVGFSGAPSSAGAAPAVIAAPPSVLDDAPGRENFGIEAFDEAQGVLLTETLVFDRGHRAGAGLRVDSHMIFLNSPRGTGRIEHGTGGQPPVTFTFDGTILGVMSDRRGRLESATNALLAAVGTSYPDVFNARGLERNDFIKRRNDWYQVDGETIRLGMSVTEPGDWIRVVTVAPAPVSVPASGLLLGGVLLAGSIFSRRRRKAT